MKLKKKQSEDRDLIIRVLIDSNWVKTNKAIVFGLAELTFKNNFLEMEIEHDYSDDSIILRIFSPLKELFIVVFFQTFLEEILCKIVSFQDNLSEENYSELILQLLKITDQVFIDNGEELIEVINDVD